MKITQWLKTLCGGRNEGGGNHPNREGYERGIHRSRTNFEGFFDNHGRNQPPKQVWRHDDMMSSDEDEGKETMDEYNRGTRRGDRPRTMGLQARCNLRETDEQSAARYMAEFFNPREVELDADLVRGSSSNMAMKKSSSPVQSSPPVTTKVPAVTTTVHAKPIQNSPLSDDLTSDPNKKTTEKGSKRVWFALNMKSGNDGLTVDEAFQEEDELEYAEPLDGEAEQVTYVIQRTLCSPKHYNELVTCDVVDRRHVMYYRKTMVSFLLKALRQDFGTWMASNKGVSS
ncbi:hypothetical protein Tco_0946442 [Tanacetum coccineum]